MTTTFEPHHLPDNAHDLRRVRFLFRLRTQRRTPRETPLQKGLAAIHARLPLHELSGVSPMGKPRGKQSDPEGNFWARVKKGPDCWEWVGPRRPDGYGLLTYAHATSVRAHRFSYELATGEKIPPGLFVDHICHNPSCVRPEHLRVATNAQNQQNRKGPDKNGTSGIRGVTWHKSSRKWTARVAVNGKNHYLGLFESKEEAGEAAKAARLRLHTFNEADRK